MTLYYHPLSSYCWKALIGLYENGASFAAKLVNLGDAADREAFLKVWSLGKFPVLHDSGRDAVVPESSIILEYLDQFYPGAVRLIPADPDAAWRARLADRIVDLHMHDHMQRIVAERLRPEDGKDPFGLAQARQKLAAGYAELENRLQGRTWLSGESFGLADCAALPALYYGDKVLPIEQAPVRAYLERLQGRASVQRVLKEAEPYFHMFPQG